MQQVLWLIYTFLTITAAASDRPPGSEILIPNSSIALHPSNLPVFLQGYKPDQAIIVFKQPKSFRKQKDSTAVLFEVSSSEISSYRYTRTDFMLDAELNRKLVEKLIAMNEVTCFRLYYKNATGEIYKYQDLSAKRIKLREVVLIDPSVPSIEVQKFYASGTLSSRTQYIVAALDSVERKRSLYDSAWFHQKPKLIKSGLEEIYYSNQGIKLSRVFDKGLLRDSLYTELYSDGKIKKQYPTRAGLLHGTARTFNRQGKVEEELLFEKGRLVKTNRLARDAKNNKKAFLLGISTYDPPPGVSKPGWLKNPFRNITTANDLDTLRDVLITYKGFAPASVISVTDEEATKKNLLNTFNTFSSSLQTGDIVFFHVSSQGLMIADQQVANRKYEGLAIPCRDANYPDDSSLASSNFIFQYQLDEFFNKMKRKIGKTGQLIISLDACHSGLLLEYQDKSNQAERPLASRGEGNNILLNLVKDENVPVVIYTATTSYGLGFETMDERNRIFGAYSLALASALSNPWSLKPDEVHQDVTDLVHKINKRQSPGYLSNNDIVLFESQETPSDKTTGTATLPEINVTGNVFVLSVGISAYSSHGNEKLSFQNCVTDARGYASFFENQFGEINGEKSGRKLFSSLLINQEATREKILAGINNAISNSKPEDYFIFNFSGYCKPLRDSSGKQVTYFVPYGLKSISDTGEIKKNGMPLSQLKDLLQMIPANNQLFITEAGSTDDFQKEFIQALIETSPTIASLSNKNRIFIVPNGSGLDNFVCRGAGQEQGPINYFVTHLTDELNVFGLFEGGVYADAVKFNLNKTAVDCDYFRTGYFDIFFERDFIKDLHDYLPAEMMQSRGAGVVNKNKAAVAGAIAKKYALLVGTNEYVGKPQWSELQGIPILDVNTIGTELKENFGFEIIPLIDKPSDSIYEAILKLSAILRPNDQLMIYVAGHGDYDEQLFDDGFIVCANSKQKKDDPYRNSYIQYSKLSRMINKLPASQVMMVLDVCFGGSFAEKVVRCVNRSDYQDLSSAAYVSEKLKLRTRLFLSSGGKREVPNGYKGRLSPFAQRFLQCLQTRGGDGKLLSSANFFEFVKKLPSGPVIGSFGDDECGSEFLMLSK